MILRLFLRVVYFLVKQLVLFYQAIYFPFTVVKNRAQLSFDGPGIVVSNHPNTLVDPLHVVSRSPRQSFFLANASIFKNPIAGFLLKHLYCIPIYRPGIDLDRHGNPVDNDKSFADTYTHLEGGGVIYIAPEGGSYVGRRLRDLKTGTARIAFGVEAQNDFKLGLKIYPAGVNYESPYYCGSRLYIEAGEPILVADWQEAYEKDPMQAVRDLTNHIADRIKKLLIHTIDEEQDQFLYRLERIVQHDEPLPIDQQYQRVQKLLTGLNHLAERKQEEYDKLQSETATYRKKLRDVKVTDRGISQQRKSLWTVVSLLGWPIWLYGRLNNIFGYEIPRWIERKMDLYIGYRTTVKVLSGVILIPLFYFLQYKLVQYLTNPTISLWYLLSLPLSGILAWGYAYHVQPRLEAWQWRKWAKQNPEEAAVLQNQRNGLKQTIETLLQT